ncbi:ArsR family transcriptional regulator [Microbacterium bovistercoris]|uniref:ArsR family transcriptional regulator n=1 Tax=Microbacterium bovistercoris TaxID=2293570 RepID=A0A371NTZ5_9MICO|nr:metalloregulator ArsR/SmtB family transcription factor [Microbacterium bovistercoris]REJ05177.1 ArsR family transcriptional regulator [Microbacterium bovistercoris]
MVAQTELSETEIDRVFHALATSTRRDILRRTIDREQSVSELARDYDMSFAAVQKHVAVLEEARLVVKRAEGRERLVRANPDMIARAKALLARYEELWRSRIARLDDLLAEPASDPARPQNARPEQGEGQCPSSTSPTTPRPSPSP